MSILLKFFVANLLRLALFFLITGSALAVTPQSGWWWNPAEGGRGFTIEQQGNNIFMGGYLYDANGRATWVAAGPAPISNSTFSTVLTQYTGGQSMTGAYKPPASTSVVSNISIAFSDSSHGTLTWAGGTIPIQRFDIVPGGSTAAIPFGTPEAGWWWNANEGGRGYTIEIQNNTMFLGGYMYDASGNPIWYASGPALMTAPMTYQGTWQQYGGGQTLTGSYRSALVVNPNVGNVTVQFSSTTSATLSLPDGRQVALTRFGFGGSTTTTNATTTTTAITATTTTTTSSTTTTTAAPSGGTPMVLYTDIVSGPTSGGEGNNGAYLTIFGKNFGSSGLGTTTKVYIGGVEVAAYRSLGASKVYDKLGLQQIVVQPGSLGNATQGVTLPITVSVSGVTSNADIRFMPNPGRILFIDNVAGVDSTAVPGDISKPYRYLQSPALYTGGAWAVVQPGDFIVMRGHGNANPWIDVGFENYFMRFRNKSGSAPTGTSGTGAIVIMGYPGEDTYIRGTVAGGMTGGCISAINGQSFAGMGQWAVISNLRMDCEGYDGPISQQIFGHNWRVINNDLSASTAARTGGNVPRMAGITGNGNNSVWYGNHIHDIQGSAQECHGIYIDGDGSYDIAYNYIHDIRDGNGFQVYVNGGNGTTEANNISLHHNLIRDVSKHGLNIADGMHTGLKIWNNIVYNTTNAGLRFNTNTISNAKIYNNTFFNTNTSGNYGALMNDWSFPAGALDLQNNIFYVKSNVPYTWWNNGISGAGTISKNLWFNGSGSTSFDSAPVTGDPLFVTNGSDFHLQAGSPAIGVGNRPASVTSLVVNDFDLKSRGTTLDLGALQP